MPRHIAIRALLFIACALVPACRSGPTDYEAHGPGDGAVWDAASGLDEIRRRYNEARVLYDDRRYDDAIRSLESALVIAHELQGRADTSAQVRYINGLIDQAQRLARTRRQEELRYTVLLSEQIREVERAVQRGDRGGSIDNGANTVPPGQAIAGLFFNQGGAGSNRVSGSRFDNIFETTIGSLMRDGAAGATPAPTHEPVTRKEFPESMLVAPMLITDADGRVTIGVERMPDAITTWKVRAIAHSIDGAFGEGSGTFRVFRDLFLNLQLPRVLTVGDELYVPLTVMNYGPATIDVVVSVQRESCLELDADGSYAFAVESKSANKQYARMKMLEPGEHTVTVTARAGEASDRVQLPLRVEPPGIHRTTVQRIRVAGDQQLDVRFPAAAPPDASEDLARQLESRAHREVELRVSPGTLSDLLLARAGLLQRPTGCLEQTLSTTLVDVEIARVYAQIGDAAVDELEHAREILQLAWQRLLAFYNGDQHRFSMWPGDDARSSDRWLDAWALLAIRGMQAVGVVVDPEFVDRLAAGLAQSLESMDGPTCAIAMWALLEGGHAHTKWPEVDAQLARYGSSRATFFTTYELSLLINAMAAAGDTDRFQQFYDGLLDRIDLDSGATTEARQPVAMINDGGWTLTMARGHGADEEICALLLLALTSAKQIEAPVTDRLAKALLARRAADGLWATTFSSAVACRALAQLEHAAPPTTGISGRFNSQPFGPTRVGDANQARPLTQRFVAAQINSLELHAQGVTDVEVVQHMWFPDASTWPAQWQAFDLRVTPATQTLRQGETTTLAIRVTRNADWTPSQSPSVVVRNMWWPGAACTPPPASLQNAGPVMLVIGVPDTLRVLEDSLESWKRVGDIARYEISGREVRIYLHGLARDGFRGELQLFAQNPGTVTAPASQAYEYYNPDGAGIAPPITFTVSR